ncbi:MAG: hypothetical protein WBA93_31795 [Microcoleaceae cyanobacterium]
MTFNYAGLLSYRIAPGVRSQESVGVIHELPVQELEERSGATPRRRQRSERSATCGLRAQADLAPGSAPRKDLNSMNF